MPVAEYMWIQRAAMAYDFEDGIIMRGSFVLQGRAR